jgi:hypothetical protein
LTLTANATCSLQLIIAFGQTIMHLPAVYGLKLPDAYYDWLSFLDILEVDWSGITIPGACLAGGFRSRLWLHGIAPLTLLALAFVFGWTWRIAAHFVRRSKESVPWRTSMHRALPLVLFIAFVLVAGTSSSIFAVWTCETFDDDSLAQPPVKVAFLRADTSLSKHVDSTHSTKADDPLPTVPIHQLSAGFTVGHTECDSSDEEYSRLLNLAVAFVAVWPIGIPLLFLLVLLNCREAIMQGRMSRLVRSTSFLHRECTAMALELMGSLLDAATHKVLFLSSPRNPPSSQMQRSASGGRCFS